MQHPWHPPYRATLALALLLATGLAGGTAARAAPAPVIALTDGRASETVTRRAEVLMDASGRLTLSDVQAAAATRFRRPANDILNIGLTRAAVWLRLRVRNATATRRTWLLDTGLAHHVDSVVLYDVPPAGTPRVVRTGLALPFATRDVPTRGFVFRLKLEPRTTHTIYLRLDGENEIVLRLVLWTPPAFAAKDRTELLLHGLYFGVLLIMVLFNLVLALLLRDGTYGYYVAYVAGFGLWMLAVTGLGHELLWTGGGWFGHRLVFGFGWLSMAAATQFTRLFLQTRLFTPRLDLVLRGLLGLSLAVPVYALLVSWRQGNQLASLVLIASAVLFVIAAAMAWRRGFRPARYYLVAWSMQLAAWLLLGLYVAGIVDIITSSTYYSVTVEIASALEVGLLSLALADRINRLRSSRDEARALAHATQRLTRYFPRRLVERILHGREELTLEGERRRLTLLFADLRGFTALADRLSPEAVGQLLNEYLGTMVALMEARGCTLDKTIGDGLMGFYGAPDPLPATEQAERAVGLAVEMQRAMGRLCAAWRDQGIDHDLLLRVGVHQDHVTVGNFGSAELMSYTAVGSGVNLAARLEGGATPGRILVSLAVHALTRDRFPYGEVREQTFRGFVRPQKVAELDPERVPVPLAPDPTGASAPSAAGSAETTADKG